MDSAEKVLKKVKALIARSSSSSKEEARTSAFLACQLIRQHDLEVSFKRPIRSKKKSADKAPARTVVEHFEDFIDDFFSDDSGYQRVDPFARRGRRVVFTTAKVSGRCNNCRKPIAIGTKIAWYPNRNPPEVYHATKCSEEAARPRP